MILGLYDSSFIELKENQWLLKIRNEKNEKTGFFSKLTKKGELPKAFVEWGGTFYGDSGKKLPVYLFEEDFRSGWSLVNWRFGMSQNWAAMRHPEGFIVEIYLKNFLDVVKETTIDKGVILGQYKWDHNVLMKR